MNSLIVKKHNSFVYRAISLVVAIAFFATAIIPPSYAQSIATLNLPVPGVMITPSPAFVPVLLKGMTIHPEDPFRFDFIVDSGNTDFTQDEIKTESEKLVKYFMASMTIPKDDLWVNLSPYESDRIIPDELGKTELGRDMLAQDYLLKQLTASLMYPEDELGNEFWSRVYAKAQEKFGTTEIPMNTFNKVWIIPESATVYENDKTVYVVESHLKVLLDSDYQAMSQGEASTTKNETMELGESIIREIILPEIEKEVNEGENFAPLRQIYHSLILAKWYKETIKNSLLSQVYIDQKKTAGVELDDQNIKEQIYDQYIKAYKKGVFDFIKEDYDQLSQEVIPRKYFSGGEKFREIPLKQAGKSDNFDAAMVGDNFQLSMRIDPRKNAGDALINDEVGKKAVVFGVGAMAKSYLGEILHESKFAISYIEDNRETVDLINKNDGFDIVLLSEKEDVSSEIKHISAQALMASDENTVQTTNNADIVFVTSWPQDYEQISGILASVLKERIVKSQSPNDIKPLQVIVVANNVQSHLQLREKILSKIDPSLQESAQKLLSMVPSLTDRIVPSFKRAYLSEFDDSEGIDEIVSVSERFRGKMDLSQDDWIGDSDIVNSLVDVNLVDDLAERKSKKIRTLLMAFSVVVYLGDLRGYKFVSEALSDKDIYRKVYTNLKKVFEINYSKWKEDPETSTLNILSRLKNEYMHDQVSRAAKFPESKLTKNERMVSVAIEFMEHDIDVEDIAETIAAAVFYDLQEKKLILQTEQEHIDYLNDYLAKVSELHPEDHKSLLDSIRSQFLKAVKIHQHAQQFARMGVPASKWNEAITFLDNSVFIVKAPTPKDYKVAIHGTELFNTYKQGKPLQIDSDEQWEKAQELFSDLIRSGEVKPKVVIHMKNLFQGSVEYYLSRLMDISEEYNGNITFVMSVEEDPNEIHHDFPSVYSAIERVFSSPETGLDGLDDAPIIHISDGGRKTRNSVSLQPFGYQGLLTFSGTKTYIQKQIETVGGLLLQIQGFGRGKYFITASDSVFKFEGAYRQGLNEISSLSENKDSVALYLMLSDTEPTDVSDKVLVGTSDNLEVDWFLSKPSQNDFDIIYSGSESKLWTLPYFMIWDKKALNGFINEFRSIYMDNGEPFIRLKSDFFTSIIASLYSENETIWLQRKPNDAITDRDWIALRTSAAKVLGSSGSQVRYMVLGEGGFKDEGHVLRFRQRVIENFSNTIISNVKKDPGVRIYGADSIKGKNIIMKGSKDAKLSIGKNVVLEDVLIDLGESGELTIPDGWVITKSFIGPKTVFDGQNGLLNMGIERLNLDENIIRPAEQVFAGNSGNAILLVNGNRVAEREQLVIQMPYDGNHKIINEMRFGKNKLSYSDLQSRSLINEMQDNLYVLRKMIDEELSDLAPDSFQENEFGELVNEYSEIAFNDFIKKIKSEIQNRRKPGQRFWVTIEGIQGTGKTYLAERIFGELKAAGVHSVIIQEDWYHQPRSMREALRQSDSALWRNHRQSWHRWDKYREDWAKVSGLGIKEAQKVILDQLYLPETGRDDYSEEIEMHDDTVFIVPGFYISDLSKYEFPSSKDQRLKVYISLSPEDSLKVKFQRDVWRDHSDIETLDAGVYEPAFTEYTRLFRPDLDADFTVNYDISNRNIVRLINHDKEKREYQNHVLVGLPSVEYKNNLAIASIEVVPSRNYDVLAMVTHQDGKVYFKTTQYEKTDKKTYAVYKKKRLLNSMDTKVEFVVINRQSLKDDDVVLEKLTKDYNWLDKTEIGLESKFFQQYGIFRYPGRKSVTYIRSLRLKSNADKVDSSLSSNNNKILNNLGLKFDSASGKISYPDNYSPIKLAGDFWLIRHGQTFINVREGGPFQGTADLNVNQLTDYGREQAEDSARDLMEKFKADIESGNVVVLVSPLQRAVDTARAFQQLVKKEMSIDLELQEHPLLREINFGEWDNKTMEEVEERYGGVLASKINDYRNGDVSAKSPSGQSFLEFLYQVKGFFDEVKNKYAGKRVLLFGHGTFSKAVQVLMKDPYVNEENYVNWRKKMLPYGKAIHINQLSQSDSDFAMLDAEDVISKIINREEIDLEILNKVGFKNEKDLLAWIEDKAKGIIRDEIVFFKVDRTLKAGQTEVYFSNEKGFVGKKFSEDREERIEAARKAIPLIYQRLGGLVTDFVYFEANEPEIDGELISIVAQEIEPLTWKKIAEMGESFIDKLFELTVNILERQVFIPEVNKSNVGLDDKGNLKLLDIGQARDMNNSDELDEDLWAWTLANLYLMRIDIAKYAPSAERHFFEKLGEWNLDESFMRDIEAANTMPKEGKSIFWTKREEYNQPEYAIARKSVANWAKERSKSKSLQPHLKVLPFVSPEVERRIVGELVRRAEFPDSVMISDLTGIENLIKSKHLARWEPYFSSTQDDPYHVEGPMLKHHLQAMLNGLNDVSNASDILPQDIIGFINDNREFFDWFILLHDIGKAETRIKRSDGTVTYPAHAEKSVEIMESEKLAAHYSKRELLKKVIRLHMIPFTVEYSKAKEANKLEEYFQEFLRKHDLSIVEFKFLLCAVFTDMYYPEGKYFEKDMDRIKDAVKFLESHMKPVAIEEKEFSVQRGDNIKAELTTIDLSNAEIDLYVDDGVLNRDFSEEFNYDSPGMGLTLSQFIDQKTDKKRLLAAFNGAQPHWESILLHVINGKLKSKPRGVKGIKETEYHPVKGKFWFLSLDKNNKGLYGIEVNDSQKGLPTGAVLNTAIAGVPLIIEGENVVDQIRFPNNGIEDKERKPVHGGRELIWDSSQRMAMSAIGYNWNGELVRIAVFEDITIDEFGEILMQNNLRDAILLGTSADVKTYNNLTDTPSINIANPRKKSVTGQKAPDKERPLGTYIAVHSINSRLSDPAMASSPVGFNESEFWKNMDVKVELLIKDEGAVREKLEVNNERLKSEGKLQASISAFLNHSDDFRRHFHQLQMRIAKILEDQEKLNHPELLSTEKAVYVDPENAHVTLVGNLLTNWDQASDAGKDLETTLKTVMKTSLTSVAPHLMEGMSVTYEFTANDDQLFGLRERSKVWASKYTDRQKESMGGIYHSSVVFFKEATQKQLTEINRVLRDIRDEKLKHVIPIDFVNIAQGKTNSTFVSKGTRYTLADAQKGGIDMNNIEVNRQGAGVDIQFDPSMMQDILDRGVDGFVPVIINLTPINSVMPLLGLEPRIREEEYMVSSLN